MQALNDKLFAITPCGLLLTGEYSTVWFKKLSEHRVVAREARTRLVVSVDSSPLDFDGAVELIDQILGESETIDVYVGDKIFALTRLTLVNGIEYVIANMAFLTSGQDSSTS
jgi:hypothetical protein